MQTEGERVRGAGSGAQLQERPAVHPYKIDVDQGVLELNDSPAGLAAWMVQHFQRWSDCDGDVEKRFTKDELLTNVTTYWVTGSIGTSFLPYYDLTHAGALRWMIEKAKEWAGSTHVPAGFALFPKDISSPPREWAQRFFEVERWTKMPRGGHFAAHEEPLLLAQELRAFFRPLRTRIH